MDFVIEKNQPSATLPPSKALAGGGGKTGTRTQRLKIVIATPLYPPEIGGPATDSFSLAQELRDQNIEVTVVPFSEVLNYPKFIRHIVYGWKLVQAARNASHIVAFDTVSVGLPSIISSIISRTALVVRVPGDYAWEQGAQRFNVKDSFDSFQKKTYGWRVEFLRSIQRFVVCNAQLVVVPSDYFRNIVQGWGVHDERLARIYLGVPGSSVIPTTSARTKNTLFSLGRLVPWKGFKMLIDVMATLPEWKLVIGGDGPEKKALEEYARLRKVKDQVTFLGRISHTEVSSWMRTAQAYVYNTEWESFSFQIVEALSAGIPVITTSVGSIPELVRNDVEGVLLLPNDSAAFRAAILSLNTDSITWQKRCAAAQEKAKAFNIKDSARQFIAVIRTVSRQ